MGSLSQLVYSACQTMNNLVDSYSGDQLNDFLAQQIALATVAYVASGTVTTTDVGTQGSNSYTGVGTGKANVNSSSLESDLKSAMKKETDEDIATATGNALEKAITAADIVQTTSTGTAVTPAGVTVPAAGTGKGKLIGGSGVIGPLLLASYKQMYSNKDSGDLNKTYSDELERAVQTFINSTTVQTTLGSGLTGSGVGKLAGMT